MARVTGIGGIFFKSPNPQALGEWYRQHLGLQVEAWGGSALRWADDPKVDGGTTIWSPFAADTGYFAPSTAPFMVNYRVDDVRALVDQLRAAGCQVDDKIDESEYGIFAWVVDPDGNKLELWQPPPKKG